MHRESVCKPRRWMGLAVGALATWSVLLWSCEQAFAVPSFARKYRTSCITCHASWPKLNAVGEAFRRNGYQFPADEESLVKDEVVEFGTDRYKQMFPYSIWPSDMPFVPQVSARAMLRTDTFLDGPANGKFQWDFPHEMVLLGVATFGPDISAWWEIEWEPSEEEVEVERVFVQFSNLFAWDEEEDEHGFHMGNRFITLPPHALNLRVGKVEPGVIAPWASVHRRVSTFSYLPNKQRIRDNRFGLERGHSVIELNGILCQYTSYHVGFANGGHEHLDENNHKDFYYRVARKWYGYPLDGVLGTAEDLGQQPAPPASSEQAEEQICDDQPPPGLEFWRDDSLETGTFGWIGREQLRGSGRTDDFQRWGFDARWQRGDLDVYGVWYYGHDDDAGLLGEGGAEEENHRSWFVQADYMVFPWLLAFNRVEQTDFEKDDLEDITRYIPGAVFMIRQNMRLSTEFLIDLEGNDTTADRFRAQLDFAF